MMNRVARFGIYIYGDVWKRLIGLISEQNITICGADVYLARERRGSRYKKPS